jgi:hypothetical protein
MTLMIGLHIFFKKCQKNVGQDSVSGMVIGNSQLYVYMASTILNSSIGKISVAKCEEENGQIIIIQGIAMKTCVVFNIIVKKIKHKHPNLTSQILPGQSVLSVDIKTWDKRHNCIKSKIRNIHWVNLAFYKQGYKNYDILSETPS